MKNKIVHVFKKDKNILIGVIHLPPLVSQIGSPGKSALIEKALKDLGALENAGFDGALLENDNDKPHTEFASAAQVESLSGIAHAVVAQAKIPVGVQMMLNDWMASIDIAKETGAAFTRLDVFVDHVMCEWGEIHPDPHVIQSYRDKTCPGLLLLTDIQVKYKTMIETRPLVDSAKEAIVCGSDVIIVTGSATGVETPTEKINTVRDSISDFPLFIGAGVDVSNAKMQLAIADGAIVGTSIKTGDYIDTEKATALKKALAA